MAQTSSPERVLPGEGSIGAIVGLSPRSGVSWCPRCRRDPAKSPEKHPDHSWERFEDISQGFTVLMVISRTKRNLGHLISTGEGRSRVARLSRLRGRRTFFRLRIVGRCQLRYHSKRVTMSHRSIYSTISKVRQKQTRTQKDRGRRKHESTA